MNTAFDVFVASQTYRDEIAAIERSAVNTWRFRNLRTKESRVLTALITSVLALFAR